MSRRLIIEVDDAQLRAEVRRGARVEWKVATAAGGLEVLEEQLARLPDLAEGRAVPRRLLVRLAIPLVQQRTLTDLPPVPARELPGLVAHNAARFFRQNGHALVTDGRWQGPRGGTVMAAAVEDRVAERVVQAAQAAGFELEDIQPAGDEGARLSLLPASERMRRSRAAWRRTGTLVVVAVVTWVLSLGAVAVRLTLEHRALDRALAPLEEPRRSVARARNGIREAEAEIAVLSASMSDRGALALRIADLAGALPAGGVQRMVMNRDGTGEFAGATPGVTELLADLASLPGIHPDLAGSPTREALPEGDRDRYLIRLRSGGKP